jgi:hypothetical protein
MSRGGLRRYKVAMPELDETAFHSLTERHRRELHVQSLAEVPWIQP